MNATSRGRGPLHPRTEDQKQRAFSYGQEGEAAIYDAIADLTLRDYRAVHAGLIDLLRMHFGASAPTESTATILDAGCGTGIEALNILNAIPTAELVAIDFCPAMLSCFRVKYQQCFGDPWGNKRCRFVLSDLLVSTGETLRGFLGANRAHDGYWAVVTAVDSRVIPGP